MKRDATRVLAAFLNSLSPLTREMYRSDLSRLAAWMGADIAAAVKELLGDRVSAHDLVEGWAAARRQQGRSTSTVFRGVQAVRTLVRWSRRRGLVDWALDVSVPMPEPYRDTRGPGLERVREVLDTLAKDSTPKNLFLTAMIRLMIDRALRRGEVLGMDMPDLDLPHGSVWIHAKRRNDRVLVSIPETSVKALSGWLRARPGPFKETPTGEREAVFLWRGRRISKVSMARWFRDVGIGRTHGLRHTSITTALDETGGDVRSVTQFARLRNANTVLLYDDRRTDEGGRVAAQVSGRV